MFTRGVLFFLLVVVVCLAAAQSCDQDCRLLQMEQAILKQTEVLRLLHQDTKEMAKILKNIKDDTNSLKWASFWK